MSIEEDRALLESLQRWQPPTQLHPIAMLAFHLYEEAGMAMTDAVVAELRGLLDGYAEEDASLIPLAEALEGSTRFMILLRDHRSDPEGAEQVADLIRDYAPRFGPFWERVGEAMSNLQMDAGTAFKSFVGEAFKTTAPELGQQAPEGSVPLKDLKLGAGRPPPWVKR